MALGRLLILLHTIIAFCMSKTQGYTTTIGPCIYVEYTLHVSTIINVTSSDLYNESYISNATTYALSNTIPSIKIPANYIKNNITIYSTYNISDDLFVTEYGLQSIINADSINTATNYQTNLETYQNRFNNDMQNLLMDCSNFNSTKFKISIDNINPIYTTSAGNTFNPTNQLQMSFSLNIESVCDYSDDKIIFSIIAAFQASTSSIKSNYVNVIIQNRNKTNNLIVYNISSTIDAETKSQAQDFDISLNNNEDSIQETIRLLLNATSCKINDWLYDIIDYDKGTDSKTIIWFLVGSGICAICALIVIVCWRQCTSKTNNVNVNESIGLEYLLDPNDEHNMTLQDAQMVGLNDGATKNLWKSPPMHINENEIMDDYETMKIVNPNIDNEINTNDIDSEPNYAPPNNDNSRKSQELLNDNDNNNNNDINLGDSLNNTISLNDIDMGQSPQNNSRIFNRLSEDNTNDINNNNDDDGEIEAIIQNAQKALNDADNDTTNIDNNVDVDELLSQSDDTNQVKPLQFSRID